MAVPNLLRRLEAAEGRHGVNQTVAVAVIPRPGEMDKEFLAAWEATDTYPKAALTIIIRRLNAAWPPRTADDIRDNLASIGLHQSPEALAMRIRMAPDYPEKSAALACLPMVTLQ